MSTRTQVRRSYVKKSTKKGTQEKGKARKGTRESCVKARRIKETQRAAAQGNHKGFAAPHSARPIDPEIKSPSNIPQKDRPYLDPT